MQLKFPFMRRSVCDGCQQETDDLIPEVKQFGHHTQTLHFCSDDCRRRYYQQRVIHRLREAGL